MGDVLCSGLGRHAQVLALHRPKLGRRKAYRINEQIVTTGDHLFKTPGGWASIEAGLYETLRYNVPFQVQGLEGPLTVLGAAVAPHKVSRLEVGVALLTQSGTCLVESIEVLDLPSDTQLYSLVTSEAPTFIANGFVVDGAPQEDF